MDRVAELPPAAVAVPPSRADFSRPLVGLFGLPFDAIDLAEAVRRVRDAAFAGRRCWVATPNLNFAIAARGDAGFRDTVLRSDLSLVDGMPLVWVARLLGLPVRERVAGADLFEALQAHGGPPVEVYLVGGPPGAAALAAERIEARGGGLRCVGFDEAGHGSIESMSSDAAIDRINGSGARFVVVALGAKKGQAWIELNASRLAAPVLCHLGAVMNFAAGTLRRSPPWMRRAGLEWLWRIKEEPGLWRRYANDGTEALALLVSRVLPDAIASRRSPPPRAAGVPALEIDRSAGRVVLRPGDGHAEDTIAALRAALDEAARTGSPVVVDLSRVASLNNAVIALLLLARGAFGERLSVAHASAGVRAELRRRMADDTLLATGGPR